ncbi:MAG TPA: type III-A CRISPR-associated RAMP protein Csm3 [Candidatus Korarchaeota archaeon]|nr:type III-A CRISPR-associated RAMP protein Csm3 [Candidatus Korarchaeota archaeon]
MSSGILLRGVLEIEMIMECLTGLRIGGGPEVMEIGGVENVVIKDPLTRLPYVPGSSLKGAMRAHYELFSDKGIDHEVVKGPQKIRIHMCDDPSCEICRVFGRTPEKLESKEASQTLDSMIYTTRLKVDDAYPADETVKDWERFLPEGVEVKYENVLDRLTSRANPRGVERVPKGSKFKVTMSYKIFDQEDVKNVSVIFQSLKLVEDDYLGGYGSRGYGRVKFENISMRLKKREYYENCDDQSKVMVGKGSYDSLEELLRDMEEIKKQIRDQLGFPHETQK